MRRLFLLVAAVVLVDTMFFAAITPLLPHYVDELGLSKTSAGILSASYAAGTLLGALPGGWLSARIGSKPTLLVGLALMSASSLVFAFGESVVVLDAARFVQGLGGACSWAAGMAWLLAVAPRDRRGALIGSAIAAAIFGIMLGPALGGAATVAGDEAVFSGVAVAGLGLAAWGWATPAPGAPLEPSLRALRAAFRRPDLVAGVWLVLLPALFAGVLEVLAPLRLDELGMSGVEVGAVFVVAAVAEAALSPIVGRASDSRGRLTPIRAGLAGAVVAAIALPLPGESLLAAAAIVGTVAALAGFWAPAFALVSDVAEEAGLDQALAIGLGNLAWAGGHVAGGAAGGGLADATSDAVPYALLSLLCALTLFALARQRGRVPAPG